MNIQENIDAYIKGTLPEEDVERLWMEFAKNPELLDQLELEVSVKEILKKEVGQKKQKSAPATIHTLPGWFWHASAAAVVLLVISIQVFREPTPTQLEQFLMQEIDPIELEDMETTRGSEDVSSKTDSLFSLALQAATTQSDQQAIALYNELIALSPSEPLFSKSHLNLGIIFYNKGEYDSAIENFSVVAEQAGLSKMIEEKAYWFLGNSLANVERKEEARDAVHKTYMLDGRYKDPAFKLLRKLDYDLGYIKAESIK